MSWRTKKAIQAREGFCISLGLEPDAWEYDKNIKGLLKDCITHHKLSEHRCNGCTREKFPAETWQQYDQARVEQQEWIEKRLEVVEARIIKRAALIGHRVYFQGDPRGCTVRFVRDPNVSLSHVDCNPHNYPGACVWAW